VVFKLAPDGTYTVVHQFSGSDGAGPNGGLIADKAGNLYGAAASGGIQATICLPNGCGVLFKLAPDGTYTVLHYFNATDGSDPTGSLVFDSSGNLYGTTLLGGASNDGVVFKLAPDGAYMGLHDFASTDPHNASACSEGSEPNSIIIDDSSGTLYGTALAGGASSCNLIGGTVFKLPSTEIPYSFFSSKLVIAPRNDYFELLSNVTLGSGAEYFSPTNEPVTVQVGPFTTTIPPGSLVNGSAYGEWDFDGPINGVTLHAKIWLTGTKQYDVLVKAATKLTGVTNPVPVTLTLGTDSGTAPVTADIFP
jgi:uncharacterized repeat protein (TIGR03803 family)